MNEFKQYQRKQIAELRPVTNADILAFESDRNPHVMADTEFRVSVSDVDKANGSPRAGDMIARNPKNHDDQWLVAKQYFEDNFAPMDSNMLKKAKAVQDESGHWYVIPAEREDEFGQDNQNEDMTDSGEFDSKWGQYMTGGDLNLIQLWAEID
jgi:hypothetical protein